MMKGCLLLLSCVFVKGVAFQITSPSLGRASRTPGLYVKQNNNNDDTKEAQQNPKQQISSQVSGQPGGRRQRRVVVVGAGWAGFGAARTLAKRGYDVTLIDGAEDPGGAAAGIRTAQGRVVEAGMKGFWYQYKNIFRLLDELNLSDELTAWTGSSFWSSTRGLEVDAPVFQRELKLPTPLGQFVHTLPTFTNLPVEDRLSLWRLMFAMVDYQTDYERYDSMSISDLMRENGVSERLVKEFIRPLLLAMLFGLPEDLSAAVIIGTFYFLVLGSQENFDVRWCRGSISERIFKPLLDDFRNDGGVVEGGKFVTDIEMQQDSTSRISVVVAKGRDGQDYRYETDAVIFAVGIQAMKKLVTQIPALAQREEFRKVMQLRCSDCIATRLWFDKRVNKKSIRNPSNVFSGFDDDVGSTFFDLNELHDDNNDGSVIASDFYHAASMLPLSDEEIVKKVHDQLKQVDSGFRDVTVIDYAVIRAPQCATLFSPGSFRSRPRQNTSIENLFLCGDWVREEPMHGADGLSQERAYVTGLYAANLLMEKTGYDNGNGRQNMPVDILQIDQDEPHIAAAKTLNTVLKSGNFKPPPLPFPPLPPFP